MKQLLTAIILVISTSLFAQQLLKPINPQPAVIDVGPKKIIEIPEFTTDGVKHINLYYKDTPGKVYDYQRKFGKILLKDNRAEFYKLGNIIAVMEKTDCCYETEQLSARISPLVWQYLEFKLGPIDNELVPSKKL